MAVDDRDLMPRVFQLPEFYDEFKLDIPPTSGLEYLRRVQLEAEQCPDVVVATLDTRVFHEKQTVHVDDCFGLQQAPSGYTPSVQWQRSQVVNFSQVRQRLARCKARNGNNIPQPSVKLPDKGNVDHWCNLCFGKLIPRSPPEEPASSVTDGIHSASQGDSRISVGDTMSKLPSVNATAASSGTTSSGTAPSGTMSSGTTSSGTTSSGTTSSGTTSSGTPPLLTIIANMDQPTVTRVLEYHINWFEATGFTMEQGCWFYALLACLEKPLAPEACALLRALARHCACLRASLENQHDQRLVPLNLLICLVSRYFDQMDLVDGN